MTIKNVTLAAALAVFTATSGLAATLDFTFSFASGDKAVTGRVEGLIDNATSEATRVTIESNLFASSIGAPDLGLGEYIADGTSVYDANSFTVANGEIIFATFGGVGTGFNELAFAFDPPNSNTGGIWESFWLGVGPIGILSVRIEFSPVSGDNPPVSAIPLPAGGFLLIAGLAGLGAVRARRRTAAAG
ncbi:VPLPA-CTERM sorting domain-containing protein [Roseobacter sinensis]|uniref:VPLPA-CTERM sorting domain-containing protein n=1 Tax=Roseobacter sinensis TaxID=2931391 RepID=A0ABT3BEU2_9RHOB|nr:VPLPA-CTERM sorting domain-containing protein [Roseobacter sp. WL0113]MCV3272092.1 VPLPA-CTERM sorting domain-containing protein [Roseobacter sp. WL0113]